MNPRHWVVDMAARKPVIVDLFSGAGGMSTGFEMAGFRVALGVEYIPRFSETFAKNHEDAIAICGDIREVKNSDIEEKLDGQEIDVVVGGPPCQGFSKAGRRDQKDPRNSLFMDFIRVVGLLKPKYFVMENVPGILTMKNAEDELVIDIIMNEFKNIGYYVEWKKLLASNYGVPQNRRRVIFLGTPMDENGKPYRTISYPQITHVSSTKLKQPTLDIGLPKLQPFVGVGTILKDEKEVDSSFFHSEAMIAGFKRRKAKNVAEGKGFGWQILKHDKPSYTLSARYWKDGSDAIVQHGNRYRMLTLKEAAAIQSFPPDYEFCGSKRDVYTQIGNAVPCLLAKAIADELKSKINLESREPHVK
jgi:DNA (cytosine-5)-methyltransferase 1